MYRNCAVIVVFCSFAVAPALADVVDVTFIGGGASGSGHIDAKCLFNPGCIADSVNFVPSGTNTNMNDFSASGLATADNQRVTVSWLVQQITTVSPTTIDVDLETSTSAQALGAEWGAQDIISNGYTLFFTLTTTSLMHLSVSHSRLVSGTGDVPDFCDLHGPDLKPLLPPCPGSGSLDESLTLEPQSYTLSLTGNISGQFGAAGGHSSDSLLLTADFTPIPEPKWTVIVPALLWTIWQLIGLRKRARASIVV
jgi:hypothetical protein